MRGSNTVRGLACMAVGTAMLVPSPVRGDNRNWQNAAGGDFHTTGNWVENFVPIPGDVAYFNLAGSYGVTFSQTTTTNTDLSVGNGTVAFDLDGNAYTLSNRLYVGRSGGTGSATFTDGTLANGAVFLGFADGDVGTLVVGAGTAWTSTIVSVGYNGTGFLRIESGRMATMTSLRVGDLTGTTGGNQVLVTGANTVLRTTAASEIGEYKDAQMTVSNGAHWGLEHSHYFGRYAGSQATVLVDAATLYQDFGVIYIGDSGTASLTLRNGASFVNEQEGTGFRVGQSAGSSGSIVVESGSLLQRGREATFGFFGQGSLTVRGDNSRALFTEALYIGRSTDGDGSVEVEAGGLVRVENSASMGMTTTSTGAVRVDGENARFEIGDAFNIGGVTATRGPCQVTVANQGAISVTGGMKVWGTSELTVDGGTLTAGQLDLVAGAKYNVTLYGDQANGGALVTVAGDAAIGGAVLDPTLDASFAWTPGAVYTLLQVDGTLTGAFANYADDDVVFEDPGSDLFARLNYNTNNDSVTLTVIPEPHALVLVALGFSGLVLRRRWRAG